MSNRVPCRITEAEVESDEGVPMEGVQAECSECGRIEESCGTSKRSVRRCLALLRENCEESGGGRFYEDDGEGFEAEE